MDLCYKLALARLALCGDHGVSCLGVPAAATPRFAQGISCEGRTTQYFTRLSVIFIELLLICIHECQFRTPVMTKIVVIFVLLKR